MTTTPPLSKTLAQLRALAETSPEDAPFSLDQLDRLAAAAEAADHDAPAVVFVGLVPSAAQDGDVVVVGRAATAASALAELLPQRLDPDRVLSEYITTPSFDHAWLPATLQARGQRHLTLHDGDCLEFPTHELPAVVSLLEEAGYEVLRDDLVLRIAQGW